MKKEKEMNSEAQKAMVKLQELLLKMPPLPNGVRYIDLAEVVKICDDSNGDITVNQILDQIKNKPDDLH